MMCTLSIRHVVYCTKTPKHSIVPVTKNRGEIPTGYVTLAVFQFVLYKCYGY